MSIIIKPKDLVKKKFLGIKYKLNGRNFKGTDCLGLVWLFLKENGIDIPESDGLPIHKNWWIHDPDRYINGCIKAGGRFVLLPEIKRLDLIFFVNNPIHKHPNHSGIMLNSGWFLHILEDEVSEVTMIDSKWLKRFGGAIRFGDRNGW